MSGGSVCHDHPRDFWRVIARRQRTSAFDGYRTMTSEWSEVGCFYGGGPMQGGCLHRWRTKAAYVNHLPDVTDELMGITR